MAVSGVLKRAALLVAAVGMFSVSHAAMVKFLTDAVFKSPWTVNMDSTAYKISVRDTSIPAYEGTKCIRFDYNLDALDSTGNAMHWMGWGYWMFVSLDIASHLPGPTKYFEFAMQGPSSAGSGIRINVGSSNPADTSVHAYSSYAVNAVPTGHWSVVNMPIDSFVPPIFLGHVNQVDFSVVGAGNTSGTGSGTVYIDYVAFADSINAIASTSAVQRPMAIKTVQPSGLSFRAVQSGIVTLSAYSLNGELATRFTNAVSAGKTYSVSNQDFSSRFSSLPSGSYFVRVNGAGVNAKGILIR
jgi:hypothetical protein